MAFVDDAGILDEKRDPKGFVDDLGLADEKPSAKKKAKGAFDEYGKADASESNTPPPDPSGQSVFVEFGSPDPEPRTLMERAGRFLTHDLPERLNIRTPSGPPVASIPPEEAIGAASEGYAFTPEPTPAGSRPASVPPTPAPKVPAGPLSRAREIIQQASGEMLVSHVPSRGAGFPVERTLGSQQDVMGIAGGNTYSGHVAKDVEDAFTRQGVAAAGAFLRGGAALTKGVTDIGEYVGKPLGIERSKLFDGAVRLWAEKGEELTRLAESKGAGVVDQIVGEAIGGAVPGIAEFMLNVPYAALKGAYEADKKGDSQALGAIVEGVKRAAVGEVLKSTGVLTRPVSAAAMGGVMATQTAAEGGGTQEIAKSAGVGAILGGTGGGGPVGFREIGKDIQAAGRKLVPESLQSKIDIVKEWSPEEIRTILTSPSEAGLDPEMVSAFKELSREEKVAAVKKSGLTIEEVAPTTIGRLLGVQSGNRTVRVPSDGKGVQQSPTENQGESASKSPAELPPASADLPEPATVTEAPARLFTTDRDDNGALIKPDFKAIVDQYYEMFPSAHKQPRGVVERGAQETWKRSLWDPSIPDQALFERMNKRIAAEMKEPPASAPEPPATPDTTVEPSDTTADAGILSSEEGFLDVSSLAPGVNAARDVKAGMTSLLLPTAKSPEHLRAAEVLGSKLGSMHRDAETAAQSLSKDSRMFDKMGVHNPKIDLADNPGVKFMSLRERQYLSPEIQQVGDKVQNLFDDRVRKLEHAGAAMRTVRENYFPGMWTQDSIRAFNQAAAEVVTGMESEGRKAPETYEGWSDTERAAVKARTQEILKGGLRGSDKSALAYLTRRQLKGKESFRKPKVFDDVMDGIEVGLVPISNNPIDLVKLKLAEMDRSIMSNRALREWEKAGDVKFLRTGQQMPEGFAKINDKYGTVYGPPTQTMTEHVDKAVYDGLMKVAKDMGLSPERVINAGRSKLGYASPSGETVTQFATELSVLAHEVGHQIDFKHDLWSKIVAGTTDVGKRGNVTAEASAKKRGKIQDELRALADLSWEGSEASDYYKQKVRKKAEKMAHMLEAYIHAPDRFKVVAPTVYADFDAFVKSHDELKGLSEIKQGLALEKISVEKSIGGFPVIGSRIAKKPVAEILNNFLSPSIYNSPYFGTAFKGYMFTANALNQTQLGVGSAFHAGFTSADVQISHNAEVVKDIYGLIRGNRTLGDLGRTVKKAPGAIITNPRRGAKVVAEWRTPTLEVSVNVPAGQLPQGNEARVAMIAKAMELAGGASRLERGLKTEWTEKQIREWYGNQKVKAAARTPIVLVELLAKPIMEWLVPRQKAGVFGELAGRIIEQNPGKTMEELTPQFRQAWNRVDARLGQVVYDRLFINNMAKNVIQGAIRAPGWTGGTIGEVITGAPKDFVNFFTEWKRTGKPPQDIPDRVAYVIALLGTVMTANYFLTKAFTGEDPEGMDYWAFRTGGVDERGKPERFILPTYAKDLFSWWEDWGHTLVAKTHPLIGVIGDIYRNHDYYGVKIRNEDDPVIRQLAASVTYGLKQFEPFWIRGAGREAERGGGWSKTLREEPQKILAPQLGIMPATSAYTMTPFEKFSRKTLEERRPRGTRTKEEAERGNMKRELEQKLRRGDADAKDELYAAVRSREISRREAQTINQRSGEDYTTLTAKSMTLEDLAAGIRLASDKEKALIKPIFRKKIQNRSGEIDGKTRDRYIDIFREM